MMIVSEAIPFLTIGNRRAPTGIQCMERPELLDFTKRFPASFEYDLASDVVWFKEADDAGI